MDVVDILKRYDIEPNRYRDQYFLTDGNILSKEVEFADINREDVVLEIGSGIGNLTEKLASKAKRVIAVEKDSKFCEVLSDRNISNIQIIQGDILDIDVPDFDKVVSNVPYSISSPLTLRLLKLEWETAVLTYQKEFAERFVARPGESDYSRLSVVVQYFAGTELLEDVPRSKFFPQPDVDSAVVRLRQKRVREGEDELFWKFIRECFRHKNKKVRNSLIASSGVLGIDEDYLKSKREGVFDKKVFKCNIDDLKGLYSILNEEELL